MWPFSRNQKSQGTHLNNLGGGWRPVVKEPFAGAWQQNKEIRLSEVIDFFAIYSCITLISGDISKMASEVKRRDSDKVYRIVENQAHKLLNKPNRYQNGVQFRQWWAHCKLTAGNTYALKQRGNHGIEALYILDPTKVSVLVADDGSVYYQLSTDGLNGIAEQSLVVPASEIIHDRYQPQFHPLIGVSPVYAAALAGALGKSIQQDSHHFFENGASLSGVLTAPGAISKDTADTLKKHWNDNYTGSNAGKVAVVGDGLKFEPMRAKGIDSQIVEQLKLTAEIVASCFHVPPYKIGIGQAPSKPQEANLAYYSDCLQVLIEEFEACLNEGLELPADTIIELDTDDLMRMDLATIYDTLAKGVSGSIATPNEARAKVGLKPIDGGDSIYMQQQNYSLEALAKRDAMANPFDAKTVTEQIEVEPEKKLDMNLFIKHFREATS
jgi:HK97 family phage portal protein